MLGVVIWTDAAESKAIIWCEDHGDLAFIGQYPHAETMTESLDQGDLIQFDLTEHRNLRFAKNARKVAEHYCADLSAVIATAQAIKSDIEDRRSKPASCVLSFDQGKQRQMRKKIESAA